jgi:hypothetical protein
MYCVSFAWLNMKLAVFRCCLHCSPSTTKIPWPRNSSKTSVNMYPFSPPKPQAMTNEVSHQWETTKSIQHVILTDLLEVAEVPVQEVVDVAR